MYIKSNLLLLYLLDCPEFKFIKILPKTLYFLRYENDIYLYNNFLYTFYSPLLMLMAFLLFLGMVGSIALLVNGKELYFFKNKLKFLKKII